MWVTMLYKNIIAQISLLVNCKKMVKISRGAIWFFPGGGTKAEVVLIGGGVVPCRIIDIVRHSSYAKITQKNILTDVLNKKLLTKW